jgi:hypothetical protein
MHAVSQWECCDAWVTRLGVWTQALSGYGTAAQRENKSGAGLGRMTPAQTPPLAREGPGGEGCASACCAHLDARTHAHQALHGHCSGALRVVPLHIVSSPLFTRRRHLRRPGLCGRVLILLRLCARVVFAFISCATRPVPLLHLLPLFPVRRRRLKLRHPTSPQRHPASS